MTKRRAFAEILLCSALWSIAGIFMKGIPWSGFVIAGFRSLLAGCVMGAFMYFRGLNFRLTKHSVSGGLSLCATMLLFSLSNKMTTAANAIVLQYTDPIWIMILSAAFFGKHFEKSDLLVVALTFCGIALFFADGLSAGNTTGNILALGSGLTFGCYYISLGDCTEEERTSAVEIGHFITMLIGIPFIFMTHPVFSAHSILNIVILGIAQLGIPYILLAHASGYCPPLVCCLLGALEPLLNPVWVAIFDGEMPGFLSLIGGGIVIATILIWCIWDAKRVKTAT